MEKLLLGYARAFPIRKGKVRFVDWIWRSCVGTDTERIATLIHGGFTMRCDLKYLLQRQFYFFGTYFQEAENLKAWARMAADARTVIDVGANLGIYSLAALAVNREARVRAFEPTPTIATHLAETVDRNSLTERIKIERLAVGEKSGDVVLNFFDGDDGSNEGMNFVTSSPQDERSIPVSMTSLDEYCSREGIEVVDLMKLDIQGNEPAALRGAGQLLKTGRIRAIFLELNWAPNAGARCPASEVVALLDEAGYRFRAPCGRVARPPGEWMRSESDVIAMPSD